MTFETVCSRDVLSSLKDNSRVKSCYLTNTQKQLYKLKILGIEPESLAVKLRAPRGRVNPINPERIWALSFRDKKGAYQASVEKIETAEDGLRVHLEGEARFMARRQSIRLTAESRNPIVVRFDFGDETREGLLVDFNPQGMGLLIPENRDMATGKEIRDGYFELRSHRVHFQAARILNVTFTREGMRLGLQFNKLASAERKTIHQVFEDWIHSQKSSFPTAVEG